MIELNPFNQPLGENDPMAVLFIRWCPGPFTLASFSVELFHGDDQKAFEVHEVESDVDGLTADFHEVLGAAVTRLVQLVLTERLYRHNLVPSSTIAAARRIQRASERAASSPPGL